MPKELIFATPPIGEDEQSVVDVRWDRESGYFQLASRAREAEVPDPKERDPIPARYGWYITLDRTGINDLIKVLRRARDQAYGKDE